MERLRSDNWPCAHPSERVKGERSECAALKALEARAGGVLVCIPALESSQAGNCIARGRRAALRFSSGGGAIAKTSRLAIGQDRFNGAEYGLESCYVK